MHVPLKYSTDTTANVKDKKNGDFFRTKLHILRGLIRCIDVSILEVTLPC